MAIRICILLVAVLWPMTQSFAQVFAPNAAGVAMGHVHLNVKDLAANRQFWTAMGAIPVKLDDADVMRIPGVLIQVREQEPTGGSAGTVIDHLGFQVPDIQAALTKWKAAGIRTESGNRPEQCYVFSPDDLKIEILENKDLTVPIATHHIHFMVIDSAATEMQAWYVKLFGAKPGMRGTNQTADVPGYSMSFGKSLAATLPIEGRVIDHIGFEVKNLEAFCKRLQAMGIKLDTPYRKSRHAGLAIAELTDPWGTFIELTEGLDRL